MRGDGGLGHGKRSGGGTEAERQKPLTEPAERPLTAVVANRDDGNGEDGEHVVDDP